MQYIRHDFISKWQLLRNKTIALIIRQLRQRSLRRKGSNRIVNIFKMMLTPVLEATLWTIVLIPFAQQHQTLNSTGLPLFIFILMGAIPWNFTSQSIKKSVSAIQDNRQLLSYRQIQPFDFPLSVVLAQGYLLLVITFFVLMFGMITSTLSECHYPLLVILSIFFYMCFILSICIPLSVVGFYFPKFKNVTRTILHILYFFSGIFYSAEQIHVKFININWNPLYNLIVIIRSSFSTLNMPPPLTNIIFLLQATLIMSFISLSGYFLYRKQFKRDLMEY